MTQRFPHSSVLAAGAAVLLSGCRHTAPVQRHFLRVPADCAGGLSSIQRARWMKENRRRLPKVKTMKETGAFTLGGAASGRGSVLAGAEVLHVPAAAGSGGLAVVIHAGDTLTAARSRLHLLTHERFDYTEVTASVLSGPQPWVWKVSPESQSLTGLNVSGAVTVRVQWDGARWTAQH